MNNFKFALIGAAGYVAPKHMEAIKEVGGTLVAAMDKNDSVGILDRYFPDTAFFIEFERFDRYLEKMKSEGNPVDFMVICSPNYLHDSHIRYALKYGASAICEKPLVLNPWNIKSIERIQNETGKKVFNILQLRLHKDIIELKKQIDNSNVEQFDVDLTYITSRGNWYYSSWKGDETKSGGIATNIGIHFFDMLIWLFGNVVENKVHLRAHDRSAGVLKFENATVKWFLSINNNTLPERIKKEGKRMYRSITINSEELEFSSGFEQLHIQSYSEILNGRGFGITEASKAIEIVHDIRNSELIEIDDNVHAFINLPVNDHPFLN